MRRKRIKNTDCLINGTVIDINSPYCSSSVNIETVIPFGVHSVTACNHPAAPSSGKKLPPKAAISIITMVNSPFAKFMLFVLNISEVKIADNPATVNEKNVTITMIFSQNTVDFSGKIPNKRSVAINTSINCIQVMQKVEMILPIKYENGRLFVNRIRLKTRSLFSFAVFVATVEAINNAKSEPIATVKYCDKSF